MSGFHDVRFPFSVAIGAEGGPERRTEIVTLGSGREERNSPWADSRRRWDAGPGVRTLDELNELIAFFEARRGRLYGFRFRDPVDWKSCAPSASVSALDQEIGVGDGETAGFALVKRYASGGEAWVRRIAKPVEGTVRVAVDGAEIADGFAVDTVSGLVVFDAPPAAGAAITAGFEFDCPARFDTDRLAVSLEGAGAGAAGSVPVVEVRV